MGGAGTHGLCGSHHTLLVIGCRARRPYARRDDCQRITEFASQWLDFPEGCIRHRAGPADTQRYEFGDLFLRSPLDPDPAQFGFVETCE